MLGRNTALASLVFFGKGLACPVVADVSKLMAATRIEQGGCQWLGVASVTKSIFDNPPF